MADVELGTNNETVVVVPGPPGSQSPTVVVPVPGIPGSQGPPGPMGPQGPEGPRGFDGTFGGTAWFSGNGPPETVIGSKPGDYYIDVESGLVYKLGD